MTTEGPRPETSPSAHDPDGAPPAAPSGRGRTPPAAAAHGPVTPRGHRAGRTAEAGLLIAVAVILVLFVVFNTQTVDVSLVFGDVHAPLVVALVIAAALGGLVVGLAVAAQRARRNKG